MSMFLSSQDISELTGRKTKSKQIEALIRMGLPFGSMLSASQWRRQQHSRAVGNHRKKRHGRNKRKIVGRKNTRNLNMPPHMHPRTQRSGKVYFYT